MEKLKKYPEVLTIDTTPLNLEGRQISFVKNLGISYTSPTSDILVIDGDRYVVKGDIKGVLENAEKDVTLLTLSKDSRLDHSFDIQKTYGKFWNNFIGCGLFFKREALEKIKSHPVLNGQIYPEELQIYWGIEDGGLGDVCYDLGLTIELRKDINLRGRFERTWYDSPQVLTYRFSFRNKLKNILW